MATVVCLLIGYPMALAIARAAPRWRNLLLLLVMLPFWTGFLMRLNAWIGLLNDAGWMPRAIAALGITAAPPHLLYTDFAMYLGLVYSYLPFMVLPLYASLSHLDPALLEAASDLGAAPVPQLPHHHAAAVAARRRWRAARWCSSPRSANTSSRSCSAARARRPSAARCGPSSSRTATGRPPRRWRRSCWCLLLVAPGHRHSARCGDERACRA